MRRASGARNLDWVGERIGPRVRVRRLELGLSVREFAHRIDVSPTFVSLLERGRTRPSIATLSAIARELGISADELLSEPRPGGDPRG